MENINKEMSLEEFKQLLESTDYNKLKELLATMQIDVDGRKSKSAIIEQAVAFYKEQLESEDTETESAESDVDAESEEGYTSEQAMKDLEKSLPKDAAKAKRIADLEASIENSNMLLTADYGDAKRKAIIEKRNKNQAELDKLISE